MASPPKLPAAAGGGQTVKKAPPKRKGPLDKFLLGQVEALTDERVTYLRQAASLKAEADLLVAEREPGDVQFDEESGEGDTLAVERERDLALSASGLGRRRGDRHRAGQDQGRHLRRVRAVPQHHPEGTAAGPAVRGALRAVQERWLHPSLRPPWVTPRLVTGAPSWRAAAVVVALDQLTKQWALSALADGPIDLVGSLRLNLVFNDRAAFSLGPSNTTAIAVIGLRDRGA